MQYLLLIPALYVLICAVLALFQRRLLYSPTRDWIGTPEDIELPYEDVWIDSTSGEKVHGWYVPHERPRAAVLFCHGNGGNNSHRLESLSLMHDLGLSVLIFDYPGYGQSGGRPSQKSMLQSAHLAERVGRRRVGRAAQEPKRAPPRTRRGRPGSLYASHVQSSPTR